MFRHPLPLTPITLRGVVPPLAVLLPSLECNGVMSVEAPPPRHATLPGNMDASHRSRRRITTFQTNSLGTARHGTTWHGRAPSPCQVNSSREVRAIVQSLHFWNVFMALEYMSEQRCRSVQMQSVGDAVKELNILSSLDARFGSALDQRPHPFLL